MKQPRGLESVVNRLRLKFRQLEAPETLPMFLRRPARPASDAAESTKAPGARVPAPTRAGRAGGGTDKGEQAARQAGERPVSAPGQASAFAASRFRRRGEPRSWPEALQPLRARFGANVDLLRRGSAVFFPTGRLPVNSRPVMFAHHVVYFGPDIEAFTAAGGRLRDVRRPLLSIAGVLWRR